MADVPRIASLVESYWAFEGIQGFQADAVSKQLAMLLGFPHLGTGIVACNEGGIVAYLIGVYVFSLEDLGITAEIDELFVAEQYRDSGLGDALLTRAEAEFSEAGCVSVSLQISHRNEAARRFYAKRGYSERSGFGLMDKPLPGS